MVIINFNFVIIIRIKKGLSETESRYISAF